MSLNWYNCRELAATRHTSQIAKQVKATLQADDSSCVVDTGRSPGYAVGMAGCGHSKIARGRAYYLYCMCLAVLTSV